MSQAEAIRPKAVAASSSLNRSDAPPAQSLERAIPMAERIEQAVRVIQTKRLFQPHVAVILGSGLGGLAAEIQHPFAIEYSTIPHFRQTHAQGHAGKLLLGYLGGVPVVVMQGRYHRYEGHSRDCVTFPVRVMAALGARTLIVTNAAGGLNPRYRPGDIMLIDQHIDWLWNLPSLHHATDLAPGLTASGPVEQRPDTHWPSHQAVAETVNSVPRRSGEVYSHELLERVKQLALEKRIPLQRGTYVATLGPTYETRSEYRMFRSMGGDAVGMSTVPEVLTARACGLRVLAMSVITNVACTDAAQSTTHEEVVAMGKAAEPRMRALVSGLMEQMAGPAD